MVDATASPRLATIDQAAGGSRAGDDAVCETSIGTRVEDYRKACPGSVFAPAQDPAWIEAWQRHLKPDAVFVTARRDGGTLLAIALEVECRGPFKVARLFGGGHANGNFPPTSHDLAVKQHGAVVDAISRDLRAARPDIDLLALERLAPAWQGIRNPLLALPHGTSPNVALAVDLSGGFEAVLARSSGSKKRKRHRYQQRRLAAAGVVRHIRASDQETASRLLTTFFELKRSQLQRIGVRNVFGDAQVRAFFHDLFGPAAGQSPGRFVLDALEVDGTIRAVTGSSISGGRMICDFAAISDDEL